MSDTAILIVIGLGLWLYVRAPRSIGEIATPTMPYGPYTPAVPLHGNTGVPLIRVDSDDDIARRALYVHSLFRPEVLHE